MPLLNKRRISFTSHMRPEMKRRRKQVYYLKCTQEVFPTYESYIKRWTLCNRPIWECEVTGRQHLTYKQAKESEQADQHRVEYKFCPVLRKQLLSHIQFQTVGLDDLAQDLFNSYLHDFATGEVVLCLLGGHTYLGQIMDVIQNPNYIPPPPSSATASSDPNIKEEQDETMVPRQANGRLRFPDAFLHPEPNSSNDSPLDHDGDEDQQQQSCVNQYHGNGNKSTSNNNTSPPSLPPHRFKYRVQLVNNDGTPLEKSVRILDVGELSRDPQWFNPTMLRRLIRESATRDGYIGAPWLIKEHVAVQHGIPTTLPTSLQQTQDLAYLEMIKKRQPHFPRRNTLTSNDSNNVDQHHQHPHHHHHHHHHHHRGMNGDGGVTNASWFIHPSSTSPSSSSPNTFDMPAAAKEEREAEKQARKEEHLRLKIQQKLEKDRIREERKKQAAVKYPIEDLDLPIYRKDPNHHWMLVDMTPTSYSQQQKQQQPSSPSVATSTHDEQQQQQQQLTPGSESMVAYHVDDKSQVRIPYPCGGRGPRPMPNVRSCFDVLSDQQFESMMAVWSFLTVFSVPLNLPTMTIETFETSLVSTGNNNNTTSSALVNSFASLLNVIIKERLQGTTSDVVNGDLVDDYLQENDTNSDEEDEDSDNKNDDDDNDDDTKEEEEQPVTATTKRQTRQSTRSRTAQQQQQSTTTTTLINNNISPKDTATTSSPSSSATGLGWRDMEPLRICKDWDQKEIKPDRKNWIVALIGCLNDVATPDLVPGMDALLHHLLPRSHCTIAERDRQFASLEVEKKLQLLVFLMEVTNETLIVKNYMDKCQDQMTELRRQKVELNKEYKLLAVRRTALEKQLFQQHQQEIKENANIKTEEDTTIATTEPNQDTNDSTTEVDEDDIDEDDMDPTEDDDSADDDGQSDDMDTDDDDESASDDEEDSVMSDSEEQNERRTSKRKSKYGQLHRSRQAKLQKKRQQQQEQTIKNETTQKRQRQPSLKKRQEPPKGTLKQQNQQQQQQQKPPNEKQTTPLDERQQLDEEEHELKRKEDQLEREMRQYMTLRIRPLGKDRFFQRYLYLDNVGTPDHHGTGRLYVQSPTYVDILQLMDRDHHPSSNGVVSGPPLSMIPVTTTTTTEQVSPSSSTPNGQPPLPHPSSPSGELAVINPIATPAWGRGGGRAFVLELMKAQGLLAERDWMMQRMDELQQQQDELHAIPGPLGHSMCSDHPVLSNHLHRQKQTSSGSWWYYYSNPYQIQQLLAWLNPKGVREYKLRNEIIKQQHYLVESMQKHEEMENEPPVNTPSSSSSPMTTRVTRNKKA